MLHNSEKDFIKRHIGLSKKDEKNMLIDLGYNSLNELIEKLETMGLKFGMDTSPYTEDEA